MLNNSKCNLWATSTQARQVAKTQFPEIPVVLEFDALGAIIYTSERNAYVFSQARVDKIRTDIRNIGALPISRKSKSKIIAAKIIPQCSFAAEISDIPKKVLSDLQSDICSLGEPTSLEIQDACLLLSFTTLLCSSANQPRVRDDQKFLALCSRENRSLSQYGIDL